MSKNANKNYVYKANIKKDLYKKNIESLFGLKSCNILAEYYLAEGVKGFYIVTDKDNNIIDIIKIKGQIIPITYIELIKKYLNSLLEKNILTCNICITKNYTYDLIENIVNELSIKEIGVNSNILTITVNCNEHEYGMYDCTKKEKNEILNKTKKVTKMLRSRHYKIDSKLTSTRKKPLYGQVKEGLPTESLGPFPEFVLPTFPCSKSTQGFCVPCFFSKVELSNEKNKRTYKSFIKQTKYIIDNFDDIVINYQTRKNTIDNLKWDVTICFACNGSLFSNVETRRNDRKKALRMMLKEIEHRRLKPLFYIETCVKDYINIINEGELDELLPTLKRLNSVLLFGLESIEEFTRDILYAKDTSLEDFMEVVKKNEDLGLQTGAFIYVGYHSMTQMEILIDFVKTIIFLIKLNVLPIIMLPNLHEFTIPHLLYKDNKYSVIDPMTALEILKITCWLTKKDRSNTSKDLWLMGDLYGGPPAPNISFYSNYKKTLCNNCSETIRELMQKTRISGELLNLDDTDKIIHECPNRCYEKYKKQMFLENNIRIDKSLYTRSKENIDYAQKRMTKYMEDVAIPKIKRELLCFGLRLDDSANNRIKHINKTICDSKDIHVAQIILPGNMYVNAPIGEKFNKSSPYFLTYDKKLYLFKERNKICEVNIQENPSWYEKYTSDGVLMRDVLRVHGEKTLSLVEYYPCYYKSKGMGCLYCSGANFNNQYDEQRMISRISEVTTEAYEFNPRYSLALSGGVHEDINLTYLFYIKILQKVKTALPNLRTSVEIVPPKNKSSIDELIESNIDALFLNLEFYSAEARKKYCPGKYEITTKEYFDSLEYAANKMGCGCVSSVLIAGLEDVEFTIEGAKKLIDIGVIPTIIPFRPYDLCKLKNNKTTDPNEMEIISKEIKKYLQDNNISFNVPHGCLECGGCTFIDFWECDR